MGIRNEVYRHPKASVELGLTAEVILIRRIKSIREGILISHDKVDVVKELHHKGCVGHGKISYRLAAAAVEMLVTGVQGDREQTSGLPLESMLFPLVLPNGRCPMALGYIDGLFIEVPLRK